MTALGRLVLMLCANLAAILVADYFVEGFTIVATIESLLPIVIALTFINLTIRPVLKMILSPLIIVTFGFFTVVINAIILYVIDFYSHSLTITDLQSLLYATSILSLVNITVHYSALFVYRRPELA
jgi:putative membrane protein